MGRTTDEDSNIDEDFIPRRRHGTMTVGVPGFVGLAHPECGQPALPVHVLNVTGGALWACFDGATSLRQVIDDVSQVWNSDRELVARQVIDFVRRVDQAGLLERPTTSDPR
jgi:hypothetical protein